MLQIYTNTKDIQVLSFSSRLVSIIDLGLFEMRNTFGLTFVIWFILECYWTTTPLNCPVNFFLCASIQGNTLIFPFDAALQLDMKEILVSSVGSISESIIPFFKSDNLFLIKQCRYLATKVQISFYLFNLFSSNESSQQNYSSLTISGFPVVSGSGMSVVDFLPLWRHFNRKIVWKHWQWRES